MNTTNLSTGRILVLDDDPVSLKVIEAILKSLGFTELLLLQDSMQVFQCMEEFRPDLVITDLEMPGLDGLKVVELVQAMKGPGEILPVLVVTAHGSTPKKRQALGLGAMDFITKPCDPPELQARVQNLLRIRMLQQQTQSYSEDLEETVSERTQALEKAVADLKESQRLMLREERLRAFAEMACGVVHDFNNTLMTITGYSLLLQTESEILDDREETLRLLNIIHTAGSDGARVVDRLREFCNARDAKEDETNVDLQAVVRDVVEFTQPKWRGVALAEGRHIEVEFDFQPIPAILGRTAEMREVVTNLIFNATDAMPHGGKISCATRFRHGRVVLELIDNGVGMTEEVRKHCLEAFFTTKGEHGTGLGLAMVASIVQRARGKVEIESEPGNGTLVRISFPPSFSKAAVENAPAAQVPKSLSILLVDDDPHMRTVVARLLKNNGHTVVHAASGLEALQQAERQQFDLTLTDHAMPGMNGVDLASVMRGMNPDQKIVLVTGYPVESMSPSAEVSCVLMKPVKAAQLTETIARVMAA